MVAAYSPIDENHKQFFAEHRSGRFTVNEMVLDQLVRLYRHTGDEQFLDFSGRIVAHAPRLEKMRRSGDPILMHAYVLSSYLGGVTEFANSTQDAGELAWVEKVWEKLVERHLYPTGSLGYGEDLKEDSPNDKANGVQQETCATVEWMLLNNRLYQATGNVRYAHALEETIYNALLGAQSVDGMKWTYYTPFRYQKKWFGSKVYCCYWSGPRGIAMLPELVYAADKEGLRIELFEQGRGRVKVADQTVTVEQVTGYPASGATSLKLALSKPARFTVKLRIPPWAQSMKLQVNGKDHPTPGTAAGEYLEVKRKWADSDVIDLTFEMPAYLKTMAGHGVAVTRGPEVMSVDSRDNAGLDLDAIKIPAAIRLQPKESDVERRLYSANVLVRGDLAPVVFTPYADAGNDGARYRTVFPTSM